MSNLRNRFLLPIWPWMVVVAIALLVATLGVDWLDGKEIRTPNRETWSQRVVLLASLGLLVVEAARRWRWWIGIISGVALIAGTTIVLSVIVEETRVERFSESDRRDTAGPDVPIEVDPPGPAVPSPLLDNPEGLLALSLSLEPLVTGLTQPMAVVAIPGSGEFYALERTGSIRVIESDGSIGATALNLETEISLVAEQGTLDLAIDPRGDRLFVSSTDLAGDNRISSYAIGSDLSLADPLEVISVVQPWESHNGGSISFDRDGYLLIGIGDGGRLTDPLASGQDRTNRLSTLLRILPAEDGGYLIPADNPYLDTPNVWPEIYAYGLRNPWRLSTDSVTGDIWIGDVGHNAFEEVNRIAYGHQGGANFGWSLMEGDEIHRNLPGAPAEITESEIPSDHVGPAFKYSHDLDRPRGARNSIAGGYVYRGTAIPDLWGTYVYTDFSAGLLGGVLFDDSATPIASTQFFTDLSTPVSVGVDHEQEILVVSLGGTISRIVAE